MKSDDDLKNAGFTKSGSIQYRNASVGYCEELFAKSIAFGDRDKFHNAQREVTHDHVRSAAAILISQGAIKGGKWPLIGQVGEYVCAALAGVGGGHLEHYWGTLLFGLSLSIGVILFISRNVR